MTARKFNNIILFLAAKTTFFFQFFLVTVGLALASGDRVGHHQRRGRQEGGAVQGGIDFSGCVEDASTGLCCVEKEEEVTSIEKEPILECTHKNVEQCHYSYVTQFTPTQEEVCEENFEKTCSITFKQQAFNETVKKCYKPTEKVCDGTGPEECRTVYESSCSTKYVEKQPGKFVGDTKCEKLPVEICGAGCVFQEGAEECHDKVIASLVDVPEEVCDLNPQKTCRFITRLVPRLKPEHQCTIIPKETCTLKFTQPKQVPKPLLTKWCLDPTPAAPGDSYEETPDTPPVLQPEDPISDSGSKPEPATTEPPLLPEYEAIAPDTGYLSPAVDRTSRARNFGQSFDGLGLPSLPARQAQQGRRFQGQESRQGRRFQTGF